MSEDSSAPKIASSNAPPPDASIDQLIQWLEGVRASDATSPLSDLIDHQSLSSDRLVELAVVDLISQRRRGLEILPENYAGQFPSLAESESDLLDLIDAELCVRREMGDSRDADFFVNRFPQLGDSIRQLVYLESGPDQSKSANLNEVRGTVDFRISEESDDDQFMLQRDLTVAGVHRRVSVPTSDNRKDDSIDVPIPIKPPAWMLGSRCIATAPAESGRYWLVKGRDTQRSETVAMKIISLPAALDRAQRTRILDLCERTSSVAHPTWIAPRIAAVNNGHLAVVRPWVFGSIFGRVLPQTDPKDRLASIVRIAYALSAAHRIGATHGGVHASNVVINHDGNVNLIDAASGVDAWEHYLSDWDNELSRTLDARIRRDTRGLVEMISVQCIAGQSIAGQSIESPDQDRIDWIGRVTEGIEFHQADACIRIGEALQSLLDQPPAKRTWWKK